MNSLTLVLLSLMAVCVSCTRNEQPKETSAVTASNAPPPSEAKKPKEKSEVLWLPDLSQAQPQNGIRPREALEFWNKWRMVTTRYRPDNNEIRFVYANAIAWKALEGKKKTFPVGAMFAKIAFDSDHDPAFPVSLVPQSFQRVQLMKKMRSGFKDSAGWSYALYVGNPAKQSSFGPAEMAACHACHNLVPQRDFVFSLPTFLKENIAELTPLKTKFTPQRTADLDPSLLEALKPVAKLPEHINTYKMLLFFGSLNESIGPLAEFSKQDKHPYLLIGTGVEQRFLLALPKAPDSECAEPGAELFSTLGRGSLQKPEEDSQSFIEVNHGRECKGSVTWEPQPIVVSSKSGTKRG